MTPKALEQLRRKAIGAEARQTRALGIWIRWRKEAARLARLGYPPTASKLRAARQQRSAASTRWSRARGIARAAWYKYRISLGR